MMNFNKILTSFKLSYVSPVSSHYVIYSPVNTLNPIKLSILMIIGRLCSGGQVVVIFKYGVIKPTVGDPAMTFNSAIGASGEQNVLRKKVTTS